MFPTLLIVCLFFSSAVGAEKAAKKDRSRTEPHCGVPLWTENLPTAEKEKVYSIWERYDEGDECENERADTKKVLETLPATTRRRVLSPSRGPSFLKDASPEVRRQFEELWRNKDIPRTEKPEKFKELAEKLLNPTQMREFNRFLRQMEQRRGDFQKKLAALSPEARTAHEKLTSLREQRHRVYQGLSETARQELGELYRNERFE